MRHDTQQKSKIGISSRKRTSRVSPTNISSQIQRHIKRLDYSVNYGVYRRLICCFRVLSGTCNWRFGFVQLTSISTKTAASSDEDMTKRCDLVQNIVPYLLNQIKNEQMFSVPISLIKSETSLKTVNGTMTVSCLYVHAQDTACEHYPWDDSWCNWI